MLDYIDNQMTDIQFFLIFFFIYVFCDIASPISESLCRRAYHKLRPMFLALYKGVVRKFRQSSTILYKSQHKLDT